MPDVNRLDELRTLRESDTGILHYCLTFFHIFQVTSEPNSYHIYAEILSGAYFYMNGFQLRKRNYFKTCISSCLRQSCVLSNIIHNTDFKYHEFSNLMQNEFFNIKAYQAKSYIAGSRELLFFFLKTDLFLLNLYTNTTSSFSV